MRIACLVGQCELALTMLVHAADACHGVFQRIMQVPGMTAAESFSIYEAEFPDKEEQPQEAGNADPKPPNWGENLAGPQLDGLVNN